MTWKTTTEYITVTGAGESIYTAGDKFNTYLTNLSSAWFAFTYQYVDSRAQQVLNVPFSKLDSTVVDYLTGTYYFDTANETNLVMDKLYQLPEDKQRLMYYDLWDRELYPQKPGINDAVRCLYYNGFAGLYSFANNKVLSESYSDFTGVIGNVYYEDQTVDIVTNGVIYNYSEEKFKPGEVYYLTDLMDGWMIPYQEGGDGQLVSVPMAVAVHENSAILLTERGMTKDLPCFPECPPTRLRFYETAIDYTTPEPVVCDNVKLLVSSENINQSGKIYSSGTPAALSINTGGVVSSTSQTIVGNTSLTFPGLEDDYIQFKNTGTYNLSSNPFSIEFWVWFDDASRHDFIMGVWDSSLRRKGWMIESPSDSSSAGKGLVFSANRGDNSDVFDIRVGCDFKFESKRWYHVALSRDVYLDVLNNTVNDWRWLVDGREQPIKLTGGSYDNTIADHNDGRLVIGAPSVDVEHQNIMSTSVSGLTVDGDVVDIASPVKTDQLELTLEPGVSAGEFIVNLNNPVRGSDYTMQQIETASVNDLVEIYFKDVSNSWELVASHSTTTGHNIIAEALPAGWRTKDIHSIKWVYTPPVGSGGYLNLQHVEFRRVNNPIDWLIQYTSRSYYTQPLKGYMDQIRIVTDQSVYRGNFVVPLSAHESCNPEPADPCADVLLHIQSDDTIDTDPIQDVSGNDHTITKHGDTKHSSAETILGASSLYFDGNGDYLKIDDASSFDFNTYFTIEFWYYRESIVNPGDIDSLFSFESSNVHTPGAVAAECYIQPSDGHVYFQIACTDYTFPRIGVDVPSQTWVHIAVTRKSNDLYMFKDGQNVRLARGQSASLDLTGQTANSTAGKYMTIGGRQNLNLSNMYINDFRCTGTALYTGNFTLPNTLLTNCCPDPVEPACGDVLLHIQSDDTNPTGWMGDISQYSRTTYNDPAILADDPTHSTTNPVVGSSSLYFDGSDWIGVPHFNELNIGAADFTIEFWVKLDGLQQFSPGNGGGPCIMGTTDNGITLLHVGWTFYIGNQTQLSFLYDDGSSVTNWIGNYMGDLNTNQWYHVAVCGSDNELRCYLDGVNVITRAFTAFNPGTRDLIIGKSDRYSLTGNEDYFTGWLQDIRMVRGALYTCNFTPPGLHPSCT